MATSERVSFAPPTSAQELMGGKAEEAEYLSLATRPLHIGTYHNKKSGKTKYIAVVNF